MMSGGLRAAGASGRAPFTLAAWTPPIAEAATFFAPWALDYFADAGLDFRWLAADGSPAALGQLERGTADLAFVSCFAFLDAAARGRPLLAVYNLFPRSCFAVFGPGGRGVVRPADLSGRRVGVRSIHSSGAAWLRLLLGLGGCPEDRVETVVTGDAGVAELLAGSVDALVGSDAILYDARRAGLDRPFVFWLDDVVPMPSDVLVVDTERLGASRPRLLRFLGAYRRGLRFAAQWPDAAARIIEGRSLDGHDSRRNRAMLALRLALSCPRPERRSGAFDLSEIDAAGTLLANHGLIAGAVTTHRYFTNEIVFTLR